MCCIHNCSNSNFRHNSKCSICFPLLAP
jgi:hypothetical protein